MRLALVAHGAHPRGGMERYLFELARTLAGDHEVHLFGIDLDPCPGVVPHLVEAPRRPVVARGLVFRTRVRRALAAAGPFDLVHSVGGAAPKADVVTLQYCQAAWDQVLAGLRAPGISARQRATWRLINRIQVGLERSTVVPAAAGGGLIAVSRRTAAEARRFYRAEVARVIYNAVDGLVFAPLTAPGRRQLRASMGIDPQDLVVLFVGDYARKRLDVVIRAVAQAGAQVPALRLRVAGQSRLAGRYRELAAQLGVAGRVDFTGFLADPLAEYQAADVFCFPSAYEPFGMVIAEAMACGLPVVVSDTCGAAELIEGGVSGVVVPGDDPGSYASELVRLAEDPGRRSRLGEAGRAAIRPHDWDHVHRETLEVYGEVLARRAGTRQPDPIIGAS
ncbi:MAG: glycosyltransferase family 4 protein [Candidatus Dormibacteria bacterium]